MSVPRAGHMVTHIPREIFQHVWLQRHVHVYCADDVAQLRSLEVEDPRE